MFQSLFLFLVCSLGYFRGALRTQNTAFEKIAILCLFPVFLNAQMGAESMLPPALTYQIQGEFDTLKLPALQWILEEGGQVLSYEKLLAGELADAKVLDLKASPLFPIKAHRGYWFKIRLTASTKPDAFGFIFYRNGDCWPFEPTFREVQTFSVGQNGKLLLGHSGTASPASKRDYPKCLLPSMTRGNIEAGETLDVWCRVTMAESCNLKVDIELIREKTIMSSQFMPSGQVVENIFIGASIALWLLAALLLIWIKKPVYVWFFIFQSAVLVHGFFAFHRNEVYNLLFRENPRGFIFFLLVITSLPTISLLQFGRVYVETKRRYPTVHLLYGIAIWSYILSVILGITARFVLGASGGVWFQIRTVFMVLIYIVTLWGTVLLFLTKDRLAQFFCLGGIVSVVVMTYRIFNAIVLKSNDFKDATALTSAGLIWMVAMALAYRFRLEIKEKEAALKDKVDAEVKSAEQQMRMNLAAEEAQRLSELDRMKTNFFSNVTHEFRTPLTLMIEPLRRVLPKIKDPEVLENVLLAEKNSRQLLSLVNQLLDMAKLESGQMSLDLRRADLGQIVREVFERFLPLAEKRGVQLLLSKLPADLPEFDVDAGKVELVLNNLISNALKFTPEGERVNISIGRVSTSSDVENIEIRIADTGIGIPPDQLDKIFDRFYQVDGSHTRAGEGTGIGLALSKELAALMGGRILVESPDPNSGGKGSVFTLVLPTIGAIHTEAAPTAAPRPTALDSNPVFPVTPPRASGSVVEAPIALVVEDNTELRNFIKKSIGETWQVVEAADGEEGLKKALDLVPDIVISDLMMPRKDGLALLDELKANQLTAHIPVVLLTAKSTIESKLKGLRHGADDYLTKPFSTAELLARMENLVENRRRLREIYGHHTTSLVTSISGASGGTSVAFLSGIDREFLQKFILLLEQHLNDEKLGVEDFAQKMFISRVQLHRKLKALTDRSATDFIRDYRLESAFTMLKNREGRVGEIALRVGFGNEKYFSTAFKEKYGVSPSQV